MGNYFSSVSTIKESESIKVITDTENHNVIVTNSEIKNETKENIEETKENVSNEENCLNEQFFNDHNDNNVIYKKQLKKKKKCKKLKKKHLQ